MKAACSLNEKVQGSSVNLLLYLFPLWQFSWNFLRFTLTIAWSRIEGLMLIREPQRLIPAACHRG